MTTSIDTARKVIEHFVASWNSEDLTAFADILTEEAHWVNVVGMHWQGKAAVVKAHHVLFEKMFRGVRLALEEVESATALPGNVIVAVARLSKDAFRQPDGVMAPASRDRITLVLVPGLNGSYAIAHGANVGIIEAAQRFNPV